MQTTNGMVNKSGPQLQPTEDANDTDDQSVLELLASTPSRFECSCLTALCATTTCVDCRIVRASHFAASNACLCNALYYARCNPVSSRPPLYASQKHANTSRSIRRPAKVQAHANGNAQVTSLRHGAALEIRCQLTPYKAKKVEVKDQQKAKVSVNSNTTNKLTRTRHDFNGNKLNGTSKVQNGHFLTISAQKLALAPNANGRVVSNGGKQNGYDLIRRSRTELEPLRSLNGSKFSGDLRKSASPGPNGSRFRKTAYSIPQFYFPHGSSRTTPSSMVLVDELKLVNNAFAKFGGSIRKQELGELLKACSVPVYWKQAVWNYVNAQQPTKQICLLKDIFIPRWTTLIKECHDEVSRFIWLLTDGSRDYLVAEDFVPLIQDIVDTHPGLSLLHDNKDFHIRYVQTVIARLFYDADSSWKGRLFALDLQRSSFLSYLRALEVQDADCRQRDGVGHGGDNRRDQLAGVFNYEHFYVIYQKFSLLDLDHDLVIGHNDLRRYHNGALSWLVTGRIFSATVIRNQLQKQDNMTYQDFVWFLLAEVDKKHPRSIEYWFRVMDLDGDGVLSMFELEHFYKEQVKRIETLGITDALSFTDCLCQVLDMIRPESPNCITLTDLKRCRHVCDIFFDTFLNVEKYLENEQRNPFANAHYFAENDQEAKRWNAPAAAWNRYAVAEYETLAAEVDDVPNSPIVDETNNNNNLCDQN